MAQPYKQSYVIVMESGHIVLWTGLGDDKNHGLGLAIEYAQSRHSGQVWDTANRPVK